MTFSFSEQDSQPDPCYLLLPRLSYLPIATDKVRSENYHPIILEVLLPKNLLYFKL